MNPFDLRGPEFLSLYGGLFLLALVAVNRLRSQLRGGVPTAVSAPAEPLSPYEVAYLASGADGVVHAAVASLVQDEAVALDARQRTLTPLRPEYRPKDPAEAAVFQEICRSPGLAAVRLCQDHLPGMRELAERLQSLGLLLSADQAASVRSISPAPLWALLLFGSIKVAVGISRGRPVGFLVVLCVVTLAAALCFGAAQLFRTRAGDRALADLRENRAALQYSASRGGRQLLGEDLVLAVGLYGVGVLSAGELADVGRALRPQASSGGGAGGSSCGSGGDGGGGGGGCGGGCGGCGGG